MTKEKAAEVIGAFAMVYPYAEIFKAADAQDLERKQQAIITIWAETLPDVDDGMAGLAAQLCLRKHKFMPTIAEFREAAEELDSKYDTEATEAYLYARSALECFPQDRAVTMMGPRAWNTIQAMGGVEAFQGDTSYDLEGFKKTYRGLLTRTALTGGRRKELKG